MRGLREILNAAGVDTTGDRFFNITGVSSDGRTFVGTGLQGEDFRPFIAVVPEPAGLATLLVGVALTRRQRRKIAAVRC